MARLRYQKVKILNGGKDIKSIHNKNNRRIISLHNYIFLDLYIEKTNFGKILMGHGNHC